MCRFPFPQFPCSHQQNRSLLPSSYHRRHRVKIECKFQFQEYERLVTYHIDDIGQLSVVPITPYRLFDNTKITEPFNPFCRHCESDSINLMKSLGHCDGCSNAFLERVTNDVCNKLSFYKQLDHARDHRCVWSVPCYTDRVCDNADEVLRAWAERESFEEADVKPTPASKVSIKALTRSTIENCECRTNCAICLEQLYNNKKEGALKVTMPCKHEFHEGCIVEWLHTSHLCPLCRFKLPVDDAKY